MITYFTPTNIGGLSWFWLSRLSPLLLLLYCYQNFKLFDFPFFWYYRIWWRLFQKRLVRTTFDIYVFIIVIFKFTLLLMDQALRNQLEHLSSSPVLVGFAFLNLFFFCGMFYRSLFALSSFRSLYLLSFFDLRPLRLLIYSNFSNGRSKSEKVWF